jgi:hypothetical protein
VANYEGHRRKLIGVTITMLRRLLMGNFMNKRKSPMDFRQKGFLGTESQGYIPKYRFEFKTYFDKAEITNDAAYKLLNQVDKQVYPQLQKLTSLTLYLRALNSFAAVIRLLELGMGQESGIVVRNLIETTIFLAKASVDSAWVEKYVNLAKLYELRYLRANFGDETMRKSLSPQVQKHLVAKIERLQKEVKDEDLKKVEDSAEFKVGTLAENLGIGTFYDTGWRWYTTNAAHPSSKSLEGFLKTDQNGRLEAVIHAPQMGEVSLIVATACSAILISMKGLEKAFGIGNVASEALDKILSSSKWKEA